MKNLLQWISFLLLTCVLIACGSAPATAPKPLNTIPLTTNIINEVGVGRIQDFQYYLSLPLTLTLVESSVDVPEVSRDGQLIRRSAMVRQTIIFDANTPGVARSYRTDDYGYILSVAFENYEGDPVLEFHSRDFGVIQDLDGRLRLQYRPATGDSRFNLLQRMDSDEIEYGGSLYRISGNTQLFIRTQEESTDTSDTRRAGGVILE